MSYTKRFLLLSSPFSSPHPPLLPLSPPYSPPLTQPSRHRQQSSAVASSSSGDVISLFWDEDRRVSGWFLLGFWFDFQRKDTNSNFHGSALPMSIFGNEEPESDGFLDAQDAFVHQSDSEIDNHTSKSVISINDLISSLYNQTEKTSLNTTQEPNTVDLHLSSSMAHSNLGNGGDHLDDTSWDFKDAFSQRSRDNDALWLWGCTSANFF